MNRNIIIIGAVIFLCLICVSSSIGGGLFYSSQTTPTTTAITVTTTPAPTTSRTVTTPAPTTSRTVTTPAPTTPAPQAKGTCYSNINGGLCNNNIVSPSGKCTMSMQGDGNLVLRNKYKHLWEIGARNMPLGDYKLYMQDDGALVAYKPGGTSISDVVWGSNTHGRGSRPWHAAMHDDCNFVVYGNGGEALWNTNTAGRQDEN